MCALALNACCNGILYAIEKSLLAQQEPQERNYANAVTCVDVCRCIITVGIGVSCCCCLYLNLLLSVQRHDKLGEREVKLPRMQSSRNEQHLPVIIG